MTVKQLLAAAALLAATVAAAQPRPRTAPQRPAENNHAIAVLTDGRGDSILVRWAPAATAAWQTGNRHGYRLERFTVLRNGKPTADMMSKPSLVINNITPLPADKWDDLLQRDERAAIIKSAIYNEELKLAGKNAGLAEMVTTQEQLDMRMGFALFTADLNAAFAKAAGLFYTDTQVRPGEKYVYRVSIAWPGKPGLVRPGSAPAAPEQRQTLQPPAISKVQWGHHVAAVHWDTRLYKGIYTAYWLEKSADGKNFTPASELPVLTASENASNTKAVYEDSLQNNQATVHYRLRGLTPFGETGPPSAVISGHGSANFSILPVIRAGKADLSKKTVRIGWYFPAEQLKEVKGFQVLRASNADGPYTEINPKVLLPADTVFTDTDPKQSNYYKIKALGREQEVAISFPYLVMMADVEPPKPPAGLSGAVNDSGIAALKWNQNRENDLLGYRVFRANNLKEEFSEISRNFITRNAFTDTIAVNTLTKQVFYKVVAVDRNFNNSGYSEAFQLKRPDKIPPAKPLITTLKMQPRGLYIQWTPSASDDVVKYILQRVDKKTYEYTTVLAWNPQKEQQPAQYLDTTAQMGQTYFYQLLAYDDAGNSSFSHSGELEFETGVRPAITDIKAVVNLKDRVITLVWYYPGYEVERYFIYRCKKGEPMELYQTIPGNQTFWEDKNLPIGNIYQYQVKAGIKGGLRSLISQVVEARY